MKCTSEKLPNLVALFLLENPFLLIFSSHKNRTAYERYWPKKCCRWWMFIWKRRIREWLNNRAIYCMKNWLNDNWSQKQFFFRSYRPLVCRCHSSFSVIRYELKFYQKLFSSSLDRMSLKLFRFDKNEAVFFCAAFFFLRRCFISYRFCSIFLGSISIFSNIILIGNQWFS